MNIRRACIAIVVIAVTSSTLMAPLEVGAAAKKPWSGNAAAVAYYRKAVAKTNALPVLQEVFNDYWLSDDDFTNQYDIRWGPTHAAGQVAANATYEFRQSGGKRLWYTVTIAPRVACSSGQACVSSLAPLEIYVTKGGDFWGYVDVKGSAQVSCWHHAAGDSAGLNKSFFVGHSGEWATYGNFRPMVTHGDKVLITSVYGVDPTTTETDTIDSTTGLFAFSIYHVGSATHPVSPPYDSTELTTEPATVPAPPKIQLCG